MTLRVGLDRLLAALDERPELLAGRPWALLGHAASLTADRRPAHLALAASPAGAPALLLGPEHGYHGVEQDMVAAAGGEDPWTGARLVSLYGDDEASLRPDPAVFAGVEVFLIDLQDVGSRYYTYAATAAWAAEAALAAGAAVWVLDRPNPLGGTVIEGNLPEPGFESFVGAFPVPVRHGLTLAELVRLEGRRGGWGEAAEKHGRLRFWTVEGWDRSTPWEATGRPWIAPSPNMPTLPTARLYPGLCLVEATEISEGRGTTRPFQLVGAPGIDAPALARACAAAWGAGTDDPGIAAVPTRFRPGFQKHADRACDGIELIVTDPARLAATRAGVLLLEALVTAAPEVFAWRAAPYEFVDDRPAIDLLTGTRACREALEAGDGAALRAWIDSWSADEEAFRRARRSLLLYPEDVENTR